jgi:hypothetical protein
LSVIVVVKVVFIVVVVVVFLPEIMQADSPRPTLLVVIL